MDFFAPSAAVRPHDLREGVPFPDETFDVVYHSHVLEHFSKQTACTFLRECQRVLRRGGTIRVAIPDLEKIAQLYLESLEKASLGIAGWKENYDWVMLEMYDQAVREQPGGACYEYYRQEIIPNWAFVLQRTGAEAHAAMKAARAESPSPMNGFQHLRTKLEYVLHNFGPVFRNKLARIFLSEEDYAALRVGRFRRQGEIHQWMYDTYSLARLLRECGFCDPQRCAATESRIPNWAQYCLDSEADGTTYKPDSMYMEAVKP
ncbi:MAG TPA: methyltransferase domain-containing protein [Candidatus Acidoferrum sp.]|nr:methyltransferase domain-containing protein [Candidatus Acidoferrum sp.]